MQAKIICNSTNSSAIIILRFIYLVISTCVLFSACADRDSSPKKKSGAAGSGAADSTASITEQYTPAQFDISLQKPEEWVLLEESNLEPARGTFAINIFKRGTEAEAEVPLDVHAQTQHSYIAIWPHGIGTELPASQYKHLDALANTPDFRFEVNLEKSKALILKDGSPWAWFIIPENPPAEWGKQGFIFAQVRSTNNSAECYDKSNGKKISPESCDFLAGDRYVREADLNRQDAQTVRSILESISLEPIEEAPSATDLIEIEKPLPNMEITSPLAVKGKARGSWYFEGSFSVELQDASDNTIAEKTVKARGKWMTDEFVPFSVTLEYDDAPDDERGRIIFHRANPSGKPENAMEYTQPVIFPPK